ncbi:MAG: TIGR00730 family Rossman fold protein [Actinomycetes bacterium]
MVTDASANDGSPARPRVCVYCASNLGTDPAWALAARTIGEGIGARGWDLVYGGGKEGLMGIVADAAMASGAQVLGIITRQLIDREIAHDGIDELVVVENMAARKRMMAEHADAYLTLPGGIGTMEEFFESLTAGYLALHNAPFGLLNSDGFYDPLMEFLHLTVQRGLAKSVLLDVLTVHDQPAELLDLVLGPPAI